MNLFDANRSSLPRWASFENPDALPHEGAKVNRGAKGCPAKVIKAGETVTLMHAESSGVVRRIWLTVDRRSPAELRRIVLRMYWDGSEKPAVECPLADFFGFGLANMTSYQSELFASPEGRSFNCFIPMPFYTGAKITFTNENECGVGLFYDVDFTLEPLEAGKALYFHAFWNRELPTQLGREYTALPRVEGHGRYLGASFGVQANTALYRDTWFGEGEVKVYMDGDTDHPTLCGTGTEDYIGDAWGQGPFVNRYTGCLEGDFNTGRFSFYRFHCVDPIYFQTDARVTIHAMGNGIKEKVKAIQDSGAPMIVTNQDLNGVYDPDHPYVITDESPETGYNFYRQDDFCSVAYFYLDRPATSLPALPDAAFRTEGME